MRQVWSMNYVEHEHCPPQQTPREGTLNQVQLTQAIAY